MSIRQRILALVMGFALIVVALAVAATVRADATNGNEEPEPCVPAEAYTQTTDWVLVSPGDGWYQTDERVVVDKEAYDDPSTFEKVFYVLRGWDKDETPDINNPGWKPNPGQHNGHPDPGPNTPYTTGNDDSENPKSRNWFYYSLTEIPGEHHDAVTHKEFRFSFDYPAQECPEEPPLICEDEEYVPVGDECETEEPPVTEEPPADNCDRPVVGGDCAPVEDEPKATVTSECVGDALVTKMYKDGVAVSTDTKNGAARCAVGSDEGPSEPVNEEGL